MKKRLLYLLFSCCLLCLMIFSLASCAAEEDKWQHTGPLVDYIPPQIAWDTTDIVFQLTENDNGDSFSPSQRRFLAGDNDTQTSNDLDAFVEERNERAYGVSNVNVIYDYCLNTEDYNWGSNIQRIMSETLSGADDAPDIYSNFVFDMTSASLRGAFANLYSDDSGKNYFEFERNNSSGYEATTETGYFLKYMKSLALSDDKMYLLASNYTIDLIRSMLVIPVNVEMMNEIALWNSIGDFGVMDGKFDITDFYNFVWEGKFTYDALATLAQAVYQPTSDYNVGADLGDVLGFALEVSGRDVGTGLFYANDLNMVKIDKYSYGYTVYYPETNKNFEDFCAALVDFLNSPGICTVSRDDALNFTEGALDTDVIIKNRFTSGNNLLFGSITPLYKLESTEYRNMMEQNKLGIVPIPVYKESKNISVPYNTAFSENACVVAVSSGTTEFAQCSYFLNYQSSLSKNFVPAYFEEYFSFDLESAPKYASYNNNKMLVYILNAVDDSGFSANWEYRSIYPFEVDIDGYSEFYATWPQLLSRHQFMITNPGTVYKYAVEERVGTFEHLLKYWNKLK